MKNCIEKSIAKQHYDFMNKKCCSHAHTLHASEVTDRIASAHKSLCVGFRLDVTVRQTYVE